MSEIGLFGVDGGLPDSRLHKGETVLGYSVLVTADTDLMDEAVEFHVPVVSPSDTVPDSAPAFAAADVCLVLGANLHSGVAPSLAAYESRHFDELLEVNIGWTVPGRSRRKGIALPFPDPIGARWAERTTGFGWPPANTPPRFLRAPVEGEYAGAVAKISGVVDDGVKTTVVGTADFAAYLDAIALASAVPAVVNGAFRPGPQWPATAAAAYLQAALAAGIDVATFSTVS